MTYAIVTSSGSTQPTWNWTASTPTAVDVAAFSPSAGGGPTPSGVKTKKLLKLDASVRLP